MGIMASGHANRANRPNTWPHRPATRREVLTCQLGAVHTWHKADQDRAVRYVRLGDLSRHWVRAVIDGGLANRKWLSPRAKGR